MISSHWETAMAPRSVPGLAPLDLFTRTTWRKICVVSIRCPCMLLVDAASSVVVVPVGLWSGDRVSVRSRLSRNMFSRRWTNNDDESESDPWRNIAFGIPDLSSGYHLSLFGLRGCKNDLRTRRIELYPRRPRTPTFWRLN